MPLESVAQDGDRVLDPVPFADQPRADHGIARIGDLALACHQQGVIAEQLPHGVVQSRIPGRADAAVAAVRHLVGIGAAGEMFARRVAPAHADHVALDIPQHRGRDPVDAPEVEAADRLRGARQNVGRDLVGGAEPAPERPAADGVEAGPERQQQQRQGAVGRRPVALRRSDERGEDQVLLALITGRAVQPVQQGRRIPERCEGIRRADDLAAVVAFFEARNGRLHGFRFKDWADFKSCLPSQTPGPSDQSIGTGNGSTNSGGGRVQTTEYLYYASFAVALCEGPITGIGRIWADGKPLDMTGITWRWYPGNETQTADPFIAAKMAAANTPAYRGTAYVVFEELPLSTYGNRLPQLSFEVFRPLADPDTAEGLVKAVTMIPASGEFTYATEAVRKTVGATTTVFGQTTGGTTSAENLNALPDEADIVVALDRLQAMAPAIESVSLVVAWFGDDLRAGNCTIKPGVEVATKVTSPKTWTVNGVARANAHLVSRDAEDRPVYGGTPADFAVVQAIREMTARGLCVTFYPFLLMDVPPGNTLPNPYSNNAAAPGQPSFPWRGRITCSPAAGYTGTADKTTAAATQVSALFGAATPAQFAKSGDTVSWTGPSGDWGLRRMILHYAHLCAVAGGVDAFLIGTEMRGLTTIRSSASAYPAVTAFKALAADVKAILGPGTKVGYASDWSEYFGYQPGDGTGDVYFHLDPLWSDANIDFIGIDNYMPLSDWRDGFDHADALQGWPAIHDRRYLQANIAGGEGFDWFYASPADRSAQIRTPITDGSAGKPWVFRYKDLRAWWSNAHFNRPGGVESGVPTAWVPQSKPVWFTELGCPAIDRGTNQPNVFFDPKSSESFTPYFSRGWRDDAIQRAYLEASYLWWGEGANNPTSSVYGGRMVHLPECAAWTWDARPYPFFPELTGIWTDGPNWRLGHWLTGRLGAVSLAALVRHLCLRAGLAESLIDVAGLWGAVEGYVIGALESPRASISTLARHFGFDAIETEGVIRFVMRGRASVATLAIDDLVSSREGEVFELTRGQETELPQALKWQVARADEDYDAALVEACRTTVDATRIASESFPMALPPEEAERRCRRALMEAWIGRESATFRLPPSRLAFDPADVIRLAHDGREVEFRLVSIADAEARGIEAVRHHDHHHRRPANHLGRHRLAPDAGRHEPRCQHAPLAPDLSGCRGLGRRPAIRRLGVLARQCGGLRRLDLRDADFADDAAGNRHGVLRALRVHGRAGHHPDAGCRGELHRHRLPARNPHPLAVGRERWHRRADFDRHGRELRHRNRRRSDPVHCCAAERRLCLGACRRRGFGRGL